MPVSRLDVAYRKILLTRFFTKGWGKPDDIIRLFKFRKLISDGVINFSLVKQNYPITIISEQMWSDCHIIEGKFCSPLAKYLPGVVPADVRDAFFQMILPLKWPSDGYRPICIHLAGTGDHFFWRRRNVMAKPLLKHGIGAIILENPYYGLRKPKEQLRSSLCNVSDIFVMGGCLMLECLALFYFCEKIGFGPLGVTGLSMGGYMASLAATMWPKPLVLVPCLSWSTASTVFTEGVMSESINWDLLQNQYLNDSRFSDDISKLCRIVDDPLECTLSRTPEYEFNKVNPDIIPSKNVTPYDMLSLLNGAGSNCPAITYKQSSLAKNSFISGEHSLINLLRKTYLYASGNQAAELMKRRDKEAVWFMKGIMDEFTHLSNYPVPYDTSLITAVCASSDGYVPREGCSKLEDIWPGCTIKYLRCGHVGAYIWHRKVFRNSIVQAFEKAKKKCPLPKTDGVYKIKQ